MNPETLPQSNQGGALDPSVVALTKAIGSAESGGNYNAPSPDKGSVPSAYQFTPGFIQKWAPIAGINYQGGPLAPADQDKLAYTAVQTMGTKGDPGYSYLGKLSPAQIASAWNAGDPNAYLDPEYGKNNAYGSTQNYVTKVQQAYEKANPQSTQNPLNISTANASNGSSQSSSGPSAWDWIAGLGGAGLGYLAGAAKQYGGEALSAGGAGLGELAGGPVGATIGAAAGGGVATALGLGGGQQQNSSLTPQSPQAQPDVLAELDALEKDMPQTNQAAKQLFQSQQQALGITIGGRQMMQDPQILAGLEANAKYGFAPQIDQSGSMNFQPAMDKSKQAVANLSQGIQSALTAEGGVAPISEAIEHAKHDVRQRLPVTEWEAADKEIDSAAESYHKAYGDGHGNLSLGHFQQMKQETGHGKKWGVMDTTTKKEAFKSLSKGARRTIEGHTQHKELYNRAMKEEQKLINGQKIMKRLNGKKAPKNDGLLKHLVHHGGRYAALAIGDKIGGPIGAILGSMAGDYVTRAVDRKYGKTIFETPAMHAALKHLQKDNPRAYKILEYQLHKAGITYPQKRSTHAQSHKAKLLLKIKQQHQAKNKPYPKKAKK